MTCRFLRYVVLLINQKDYGGISLSFEFVFVFAFVFVFVVAGFGHGKRGGKSDGS
jgi:hypothetical protein